MGKFRDLLGKLGIVSPSGKAGSNADVKAAGRQEAHAPVETAAGRPANGTSGGKVVPVKNAKAGSLEEKRKAAREHMRNLRAKRKKEGYTEKELARQREYNRKFMRKWRAKKRA